MNRPALLAALLLISPQSLAFDFTSIDHWIGEGDNQAALVVDWDEVDTAGPSLSWGYRWNGTATSLDLLRAVLAEDPRFFAKMDPTSTTGVALYGLGYDRNGDSEFSLSDGTDNFNADGIVDGSANDEVGPQDPEDLWAEGWDELGFWHYLTYEASGWVSSYIGFYDRVLFDGAIDGWVYTEYQRPDGTYKPFTEWYLTTPDPPHSTPAPRDVGDFNGDGLVDALDYTMWRDTEPSMTVVAGIGADADHSSVIDSADLTLWQSHYSASASEPGFVVPEANHLGPALAALLFTFRLASRDA